MIEEFYWFLQRSEKGHSRNFGGKQRKRAGEEVEEEEENSYLRDDYLDTGYGKLLGISQFTKKLNLFY